MTTAEFPTLKILEARYYKACAEARRPADIPTRIECSPTELDSAWRELAAWAKANRPGCRYVICKRDGAPLFLGCGLYASQP